jgi:hypothetical protein
VRWRVQGEGEGLGSYTWSCIVVTHNVTCKLRIDRTFDGCYAYV